MRNNITQAKFYLSLLFVIIGTGCVLFLKADETQFMGIPSNKFMWGSITILNLIPVVLYLKQGKSNLNQQ